MGATRSAGRLRSSTRHVPNPAHVAGFSFESVASSIASKLSQPYTNGDKMVPGSNSTESSVTRKVFSPLPAPEVPIGADGLIVGVCIRLRGMESSWMTDWVDLLVIGRDEGWKKVTLQNAGGEICDLDTEGRELRGRGYSLFQVEFSILPCVPERVKRFAKGVEPEAWHALERAREEGEYTESYGPKVMRSIEIAQQIIAIASDLDSNGEPIEHASTSPFDQSEYLVKEVLDVIDLPVIDTERARISNVACSLSLEHWHSTRALLELGLLPSALVVHRAQFEALVRSLWLTFAASEADVAKLTAHTLDLESEQAAKNIPSVQGMMETLQYKAPPQAYDALSRFKENSWKVLNSYTHAGIHPLRRHEEGYPVKLIHNVLCNANGLGVVGAMQAVSLSAQQPLQKQLLEIAGRYPQCMPAALG